MSADNLASAKWFALMVRARQEIRTAAALRCQSYEVFLPLCADRAGPRGRPARFRALFPGYLFTRFDPLYRLPILQTAGVRAIVGFGRIPTSVDPGEIDALKLIVRSGIPAGPVPYLEIGQRVRICEGSLRGLEGILLQYKNTYRVIVSVTLLRRSVAVEIDASSVVPVEGLREWRAAPAAPAAQCA